MPEVLKNLAASRKALVMVAAVIAVTVLAGIGKLGSAPALDFIKWIVGIWLGAQAAEDMLVKPAALKQKPTASADD